jgi:hypothetical protein
MAFKYIKQTALVAALLHIAAAQQKSNIVPEDLKAGFKSSGTEMQASYTNEAVNGFRDGTLFTKDGKQAPQSHPKQLQLTPPQPSPKNPPSPWATPRA